MTTSTKRGWLICGLLWLFLLPSLGRAAEPHGKRADCEATAECAPLLQTGIKEYQQKHYVPAMESFEKAYATCSDPRLLVLMGRTRFKQGDTAAALDYFTRARSQLVGAADRTKLEQYITEARAAASKPGGESGATGNTPATGAPDLSLHADPAAGGQPGGVGLRDNTTSPASEGKRMKPWMWAAIGIAAAAVVGTAVGVGVYFATGTPTPDATVRFP